MRARERNQRRASAPRVSLLPFGMGLGLLAGCVSAVCVHLTIQSSTRCLSGKSILVGLVFGAITGIVFGLVGSILVWFASLFAPGPR
jgi:H+/Cl- antiporter ClcA